MAEMLGADFDPLMPDDGDLVKYGASWIRDLKARLQRFLAVIFNLETGQVRDGVVQSSALADLSPDPTVGMPSTGWPRVTVNAKGLVTGGVNDSVQPTARPYRAVFTLAGAYYETADSVVAAAAGTPKTYSAADGTVKGSYTVGCQYLVYSWLVPEGVTRIRALVVGGGGAGRQAPESGGYGGGGGGAAFLDAGFAVAPGDSVVVCVGNGAAGEAGGGPSGVKAGGAWAFASGGASGTTTAGGAAGVNTSSSMAVFVCQGQAGVVGASGVAGTGGRSGFYLSAADGRPYGSGVTAADGTGTDWAAGSHGLVVLEWLA